MKMKNYNVLIIGSGPAGLFAAIELEKLGLDKIAIIDRNQLGATDFTENVLTLEPLSLRWQSFGWEAIRVNGHSFEDLMSVFSSIKTQKTEKPLVIIANTIKGKGVSFMEASPLWHHRLPKGEQISIAMQELGMLNS